MPLRALPRFGGSRARLPLLFSFLIDQFVIPITNYHLL
jgi:hypothetical protein